METSRGRSRRVPSSDAAPPPTDHPRTDPAAAPEAPATRASTGPPTGAAAGPARRAGSDDDGGNRGADTAPTDRRRAASDDDDDGNRGADTAPTDRPGRRRAGSGRRAAEPATGPDNGPTPGAVPREPGRGHRRRRPLAGARPGPARGRRRTDPATDRQPNGTRTEAPPPADHDPDAGGDPAQRSTRRRVALIALGLTAVASATALVAGLPSWSSQPTDPTRALTPAETGRLTSMRVTNQRDVRAGVHVTIGTGQATVQLVGWVDWARPLVYLSVAGPDAGTERGLVQANRSALVVRPDPAAASASPPLVPPADGWRLREPPAGRGVAAVRDLLLGLSADRNDAAPAAARWRGQDTINGSPIDIIETPLPTPPSSPATAGPSSAGPPTRAPRLWLDQDARLHRLRGWLPDGTPVAVELARSDRPALRPVDALGGPPGLRRALTDAEADRLARLATRLRAAGGAKVTLTAPLGSTANLRAAGWLSWAAASAYLAVGESDAPGRRTLLRWRSGQVARVEVPAAAVAAEFPAAPPLPPPAGLAWPAGRPPGDDLDRLLAAALRAGTVAVPAESAVRLRQDRVAGHAVDVVEMPSGRAALRYWIEGNGLLRRLELRTGPGVWAQLDLTLGRVPTLPTA